MLPWKEPIPCVRRLSFPFLVLSPHLFSHYALVLAHEVSGESRPISVTASYSIKSCLTFFSRDHDAFLVVQAWFVNKYGQILPMVRILMPQIMVTSHVLIQGVISSCLLVQL